VVNSDHSHSGPDLTDLGGVPVATSSLSTTRPSRRWRKRLRPPFRPTCCPVPPLGMLAPPRGICAEVSTPGEHLVHKPVQQGRHNGLLRQSGGHRASRPAGGHAQGRRSARSSNYAPMPDDRLRQRRYSATARWLARQAEQRYSSQSRSRWWRMSDEATAPSLQWLAVRRRLRGWLRRRQARHLLADHVAIHPERRLL